jgi:hypothetical protein
LILLPSNLSSIDCAHRLAFDTKYLEIAAFSNLTSLHLSERDSFNGDRFTFSNPHEKVLGIVCNGTMRQLRSLSLAPAVTTVGNFSSYIFPSGLESLSLRKFAGYFPAHTIAHLEHLEKLELPAFHSIILNNDCFPFLKNLRRLKVLNIRQCQQIQYLEAGETKLSAADLNLLAGPNCCSTFFASLSSLSSLNISILMIYELLQATSETGIPEFWDKLSSLNISGSVTRTIPLPQQRLQFLNFTVPKGMSPDILPRTIVSLSLPDTSLSKKTLSDLPPKLTKLAFTRYDKDFSEQDMNETLQFPPSLVHIIEVLDGTSRDFKEERFLRCLPKTVVLYEGNSVYIRLPEDLIQKHADACVESTGFTNLDYAISAGDIKLAEYLITYWDQEIDLSDSRCLFDSVEKDNVEMFSFLARRLRSKGHLAPNQCTSLGLAALSSPKRVELLEILVRDCGINPSSFNIPDFVSSVIHRANIKLLKWMQGVGFNQWDQLLFSSSILSMAFESNKHQNPALSFLLSNGSKTVEISETLSFCLGSKNVDRLERLKEYAKRWEILCPVAPGVNFSMSILTLPDPSFLFNIIEWLLEPSNQLAVQFDSDWLRTLRRAIFVRFVHRLPPFKNRFKDLNESRLDLLIDIMEDELNLAELSLGEVEQIRANSSICELSSTEIITIARFFVSQGLNIWEQEDGSLRNRLVDIGLILNSVEVFQISSSLLRGELVTQAINDAGKWGCSSSLIDHLRFLEKQATDQDMPSPQQVGLHAIVPLFKFSPDPTYIVKIDLPNTLPSKPPGFKPSSSTSGSRKRPSFSPSARPATGFGSLGSFSSPPGNSPKSLGAGAQFGKPLASPPFTPGSSQTSTSPSSNPTLEGSHAQSPTTKFGSGKSFGAFTSPKKLD